MLKIRNYRKGYLLLSILLLISSVNSQMSVKFLKRETIQNLQSQALPNDENSLNIEKKESIIASLSRNTKDLDKSSEDGTDEEMEEEIIAEDEDGNMFLLVPNDLMDSTSEDETIIKLKNTPGIDDDDNNDNYAEDTDDNEDFDSEEDNIKTEVTGNDDNEPPPNYDDDYKITTSDDNVEDYNENENGRGHQHQHHHKKKKVHRATTHSMTKPFRKFKRIIRRGIKHPKRTFKKVLKAIILPKSAVGVIASSMLSNAVGFGTGGLAGMTAGTIAGGIASGIFRNFGNYGKTAAQISNRGIENRGLNDNFGIQGVPVVYLLNNPKQLKQQQAQF